MTRPVLPNSPLVDVVFELKFAGDLLAPSAWGRMQNDLRSTHPQLFVPGAAVGQSPLLQPVQLVSADNRRRISLAVNSFAVSTSAYVDFADFQQDIDRAYEVFSRHLSVREFTRAGLRYTNVLPRNFATENERPAGSLHPCLKLTLGGLLGLTTTVAEPSQLVFNSAVHPLSLRVSLLQTDASSNTVNLDFDCYEMGPISFERVPAFVASAHELVDNAFFAIVSDEYHAYLQGNT